MAMALNEIWATVCEDVGWKLIPFGACQVVGVKEHPDADVQGRRCPWEQEIFRRGGGVFHREFVFT